MQLGMIGLGRMGANMARRLLRSGHQVVVLDRDPGPGEELRKDGALPMTTLEELVAGLKTPRHVWLMVPSGEPVTQTITSLAPLLSAGDCIIDGGNSNYRDSVARATASELRSARTAALYVFR